MTQGIIVNAVTNMSVDGSTAEFEFMHGSKPLNIYVTGNFGGGTLVLEAKTPSGVFVPVNGITIADVGMFSISPFAFIGRFTLTGATTPNVTIDVQGAVRLVQ